MKKYTKKERKAIHSALVAAVPYLWDGGKIRIDVYHAEYICYALAFGGKSGHTLARSMIHERLNGYSIVEYWLRYGCKIPKRQLTDKNVQAYRHRWLAALIEEFSV